MPIGNYKTNTSFFMYVKIPSSYLGIGETVCWFNVYENDKIWGRLLIDPELDDIRADFKLRNEWYPRIITYSVVTNPWNRAVIAFNDRKKINLLPPDLTFENFILSISKFQNSTSVPKSVRSQASWLEYTQPDGTIKTVDHIFRVEHLDEDFKVFQEFFEEYTPIVWRDPIPEYRSYYNDTTKQIIKDIFKDDIERFDYTF